MPAASMRPRRERLGCLDDTDIADKQGNFTSDFERVQKHPTGMLRRGGVYVLNDVKEQVAATSYHDASEKVL
jgi:hypothetical protein